MIIHMIKNQNQFFSNSQKVDIGYVIFCHQSTLGSRRWQRLHYHEITTDDFVWMSFHPVLLLFPPQLPVRLAFV